MPPTETLYERWMRLCDEASHEMNPERLMALVKEINAMMEKGYPSQEEHAFRVKRPA
jgi:hypothetical protein